MLLPIKEYMNEDGLANVNHKGYLDQKLGKITNQDSFISAGL